MDKASSKLFYWSRFRHVYRTETELSQPNFVLKWIEIRHISCFLMYWFQIQPLKLGRYCFTKTRYCPTKATHCCTKTRYCTNTNFSTYQAYFSNSFCDLWNTCLWWHTHYNCPVTQKLLVQIPLWTLTWCCIRGILLYLRLKSGLTSDRLDLRFHDENLIRFLWDSWLF